MSETGIDFKIVTDLVVGLLGGVEEGRIAASTPCEEFTVGHLLNHMLGLTLAFTAAARGERGPHNDAPPRTPEAVPPHDWRPVLEARLRVLADAWTEPSAWEGDATAGGVTFPAAIMGIVALNEVAVHGWDLATATGQRYELDPATVELLTGFVGQDADDQSAREGVYGPPVAAAEDASPQDRLIALTGRDPNWLP
jgi:uncharacterized protein (TIGR03086 family)